MKLFAFALALLGFVFSCQAETTSLITKYSAGGAAWQDTKAEACSVYVSQVYYCTTPPGLSRTGTVSSSDPTCAWTTNYCDGGAAGPSGSTGYSTTTGCPSTGGWTQSGSTCVRPDCEPGETRQADGSCVPTPTCGSLQTYDAQTGQCGGCDALQGQSAMVGGASAWGISGSSSGCMSGANFGGCAMGCTGGASSGGLASCTGCTFTGDNAPSGAVEAQAIPAVSNDTATPITPGQCLAQGQGYITTGGVTSCIAASSSPASQPTEVSTVKTVSTTIDNVTSTATTQQTSSFGGGGYTQTSTTSSPGNPTTSSTSSGSTAGFCAENPQSPLCTGQQDECKQYPDRVGCMSAGTPEAVTDPETKTLGVESITPVSFGTAGACPAPIQLPRGAQFSFQPTCDFMSAVRPFLLAFAWLTAGMLVIGAVRGGNG